MLHDDADAADDDDDHKSYAVQYVECACEWSLSFANYPANLMCESPWQRATYEPNEWRSVDVDDGYDDDDDHKKNRDVKIIMCIRIDIYISLLSK